MGALTTNTTIKGDGLKFNVRSMKFERVIDFTTISLTSTPYYEIGDLPDGFIPQAIAILVLKKGTTTATAAVYAKSSDASALVSASIGAAGANVYALVSQGTVGAADSLALKLSAAPTDGLIKVVVAGVAMTDVWDDGAKRDAFDPKEHLPATATTATA